MRIGVALCWNEGLKCNQVERKLVWACIGEVQPLTTFSHFNSKKMDVASMSALSAACRTVVTVSEQRLCDEKEKRNRETMAMMAEDIAGVKRQREDATREWFAAAELCNQQNEKMDEAATETLRIELLTVEIRRTAKGATRDSITDIDSRLSLIRDILYPPSEDEDDDEDDEEDDDEDDDEDDV